MSTKVMYNSEDKCSHEGVAAVVKNGDGKILMMDHVKFDFFTIPVGKCKSDESIHDGLMVEMKEEIGIEVKEYTDLGNFIKVYDRDGVEVSVDTHIIEVHSFDGEVFNAEPEKHRSIEWMSVEEILELPIKKISNSTMYYLRLIGAVV